MKNKRILVMLALLISVFFIGFTYAFYTIRFESNAEIEVGSLDSKIETIFESPNNFDIGDKETYNFKIKNTSTEPFMVRVSFDEEWIDGNGNSYSNVINNEKIGIINFDNSEYWKKIGDYYYYKESVGLNETTEEVINGFTFSTQFKGDKVCGYSVNTLTEICTNTTDYRNLTYKVKITTEVASLEKYEDKWNVDYEDINVDSNYEINFYPNLSGTTNTMNNQNLTYGTDVTISKNTYQKQGYIFKGWNTKYDGSGVTYQDEEEIRDIGNGDTDVVNLYAMWNGIYSVSFASSDNNCPLDTTIYKNIDNIEFGTVVNTLPIPNPECTGYIFTGWESSGDIDTTTAKYGMISTPVSSWVERNKGVYFNSLSTTPGGSVTLTARMVLKNLYNIMEIDNHNGIAHKYEGDGSDSYDNDVYYYQGDTLNNYVLFGEYCFRMFRTTDTGGVKMIYDGKAIDGKCENTRQDSNGITGRWREKISLGGNYKYGTGFIVNEHNMFIITGQTKTGVYSDSNYANYQGLYTCKNLSGECTTLYYVNAHTTGSNSFGAQYTIGTIKYNEIGTSTYNANHSSLSSVGYMYNKTYNLETEAPDASAKYGSSVTYSNGVYTLTNVQSSLDNTHHYSCDNGQNTCENVRYYYYSNIQSGGTRYRYITLSGEENINDAINKMLYASNVNTYSSDIKAVIDAWYLNNIKNYESKIEDTVYCNDRSIGEYGGWSSEGSITDFLTFNTGNRPVATLECSNLTDKFTVSNTKGNGALDYPVGLLSNDERWLTYSNSSNPFTTERDSSWLMSPSFKSDGATSVRIVGSNGSSGSGVVHDAHGVRPVISLKSTTLFTGGDGSAITPYVIDLTGITPKRTLYIINDDGTSSSYSVNDGDSVTLTKPTKENSTFIGWYVLAGTPSTLTDTNIVLNGNNVVIKPNYDYDRFIDSATFSGSNYINTGLNLFSRENIDKNFEISFKIVSRDATTSQATMINAKLEEEPYPGFAYRVTSDLIQDQLSISAGESTYKKNYNRADIERISIKRVNGILYLKINDGSYQQVLDTTSLTPFDIPLTIGASLDSNGNPWRYFKGTLEDIKITLGTGNYTIIFNGNGATGNMSNQTMTRGLLNKINANTFIKDGYLFKGWNTESNGSGTHYNDEEIVTNLALASGNITLYAEWEKITVYDVSFASSLANCPLNSTTYMTIQDVQYYSLVKDTAIANPECPGYNFTGWTASGDINTTTAKYGITSLPETAWVNGNKGTFFKNLSTTDNGTVTLTAGWQPAVYTLTLDNQSATTIGTTEIFEKYSTNWYSEISATNVITTITKPVKTGYYFDGYYTGQNGAGTKVIDSAGTILSTNTAFTSSTTLYAYWVEVWAENLSFDPTTTGFSCNDAQCAIDELYDLLH